MKQEIIAIKRLIAIGILVIPIAIWFSPKPIVPSPSIVQFDINDREKGICADMYKQGFKWGYGQYSVTVATDRITKRTDEEIKDHLLKMAQEGLPEDF